MLIIGSWLVIIFYALGCMGIGLLSVQLLLLWSKTKARIGSNAYVIYSLYLVLGAAILGMVWTYIALGKILTLMVILGVLIPAFIACIVSLWMNQKAFIESTKDIFKQLLSLGWIYNLIILAALYFFVASVVSKTIISSGDATAYYLAFSKMISAAEALVPMPGYYWWPLSSEALVALGVHGELHHAVLFSLGIDHLSRFFDVPLMIASIIIYLSILARTGIKTRGMTIGILLILSTSAVMNVTMIGKVDTYALVYAIAIIYFSVAFYETPRKLFLMLGGFLMGTAAISKLNVLAILMLPTFILLFWQSVVMPYWNRRKHPENTPNLNYSSILIGIGIFFGAMILAEASNLIKNYILFNNPLAPFIPSDPSLGAISSVFSRSLTARILVTYPIALTFFNIPANPGHLSPLFLAFLPFPYFYLRNTKGNNLARLCAFAGLVGLVFWILVFPSVAFVRYIFPALLLMFPLILLSVEYIMDCHPLMKYSIEMCLVIAAIFGLINPASIRQQVHMIRYYQPDPTCDMSYCQEINAINQDSTPGDRLLNLASYRFWLRPDLMQCSATTQETNEILDVQVGNSWETAYRRGIKYIALDLINMPNSSDLQKQSLPIWLTARKIYQNEQYVVYRMDAVSPPYPPSVYCTQVDPPEWNIVPNSSLDKRN